MQVVHRYEKSDPNFGWEFEDWNFNTVFKASSKEETKLKLSVLGYRLLSGVRCESSGYTIYDVSAERKVPESEGPDVSGLPENLGSRPARVADRQAADTEPRSKREQPVRLPAAGYESGDAIRSCPEQNCRLIAKA